MSGISGYPSQEKLVNPLDGYNELNSKTSSQFVTVHETADKSVVADVQVHGVFNTSVFAKAIASIDVEYPKRVIHSLAHGAKKGDRIRFDVGSANVDFASMVIDTPDANTIILGSTLPNAPLITDTFFVQRSVTPLYAQDGTLITTAGPIQFVKDAVNVQVTEDTVTPANNLPLPVKLTSVTGDINITAGDLNVQLSHAGANFDSTRIGDGTNLLGVNASNEAKVNDASANTTLASIDGKIVNGTGTAPAAVRVVLEDAQSTNLADTASILSSASGDDGVPITLTNFLKVGGSDGTQERLLAMSATGHAIVDVASSALPAGAATEATLAAASAKLPATLGQKTMANSMAIVVASDQSAIPVTGPLTDAQLRASAVPVSAASLPLPTGAATEATLSTLNGKVTACNTGAVTVAASALPTGASTSALQTTGNTSLSNIDGKLPATVGQKAMAASLAVVVASDQSTIPVSAASLPLPTGAATEATLAAMSAKMPATLGQKTMANSFAVTLAFDQTALPTSVGRSKVGQLFNDYTVTSVTTGAYVQLTASTASVVNKIEIFDSSGEALILAVGAAASEVDQLYIFPGGNGMVELAIPASSRISVKAKTATASSGFLAVNLYS